MTTRHVFITGGTGYLGRHLIPRVLERGHAVRALVRSGSDKKPVYWLFERAPATRASSQRLGLVRLRQMIRALVRAVENPVSGIRMVEVPEIRAG